jgi:hypothetical protein
MKHSEAQLLTILAIPLIIVTDLVGAVFELEQDFPEPRASTLEECEEMFEMHMRMEKRME